MQSEISSLIEQNPDSIVMAIKSKSDMNVIVDENGLAIKNGAFQIKNENGNTIMWINEKGHIMVKDLRLDNEAFGRNSEFTSSLANMERLSLGKVSISSQLAINENDFYIYKDGECGYNLRQYVKDVLSDYNLI